jgi:hypothetical protein
MLLQIGALDSWLLRLRHVQRQTVSGEQHGYRYGDRSKRLHVDFLQLSWKYPV